MTNRYPWIIDPPADHAPSMVTPTWDRIAAYGAHDVVIEHPDHEADWTDYDPEHGALLLRTIRERVTALEARPGVAHVSVFRNRGRPSGSSQPHPHAQIIATPVMGPDIRARSELAEHHYETRGETLLANAVARARTDNRIVYDRDGVIAFCPYAPRNNYELLIAPHDPCRNLAEASDATLASIAAALPRLVRATLAARGRGSYNLAFHQPPTADRDAAHAFFMVELAPRTGNGAGFELVTGFSMITTPPELAAAEIRNELTAIDDELR